MTNISLKSLKKVKYKDILYDLIEEIRMKAAPEELQITVMAVIYSLYKTQSGDNFIGDMNGNDQAAAVLNHYIPKYWDIILSNMNKYPNDILLAFLLFDQDLEERKGADSATPEYISKLVCSILDIQDNDEVIEFCSGKGHFPVELCCYNEKANYKGVEIDRINKDIATLRASLLPLNCWFILDNVLEYQSILKYDKLFSNYPFMVHDPVLPRQRKQISQNMGIDMELISKCSSDWLFNLVLTDHMKEEGKAAALMTNGASWNQSDQKIRKYFIEKGYVEAVVSLPDQPYMLIIFSHDNDRVRMIDAGHLSVSRYKKNTFTDENITEVVWLLNHDSRVSVTKTIKELSQNQYILNASRYIESIPEIENGVEFGSVIKNITRGSQIKAKDLEVIKAAEETPYQYLMISNINDGVIDFNFDNGQFLKEIPPKAEKYCIKDRSIVLSKIGIPSFKSAVAKVTGNRKLLANGNLFIIEIDEEKANPYFIQSFFTSRTGKALLNSIHTGASMPTISIEKLKKMKIPLPEITVQNKIADEYEESVMKISLLKKELRKEIKKMNQIYDQPE